MILDISNHENMILICQFVDDLNSQILQWSNELKPASYQSTENSDQPINFEITKQNLEVSNELCF